MTLRYRGKRVREVFPRISPVRQLRGTDFPSAGNAFATLLRNVRNVRIRLRPARFGNRIVFSGNGNAGEGAGIFRSGFRIRPEHGNSIHRRSRDRIVRIVRTRRDRTDDRAYRRECQDIVGHGRRRGFVLNPGERGCRHRPIGREDRRNHQSIRNAIHLIVRQDLTALRIGIRGQVRPSALQQVAFGRFSYSKRTPDPRVVTASLSGI